MAQRVFCDTETTGLSAVDNQILTAAFCLYEHEELVDTLEIKVAHNGESVVEPRALEVNQIDLEEHNSIADCELDACNQVVVWCKKHGLWRPKLYGHNVSFDIGFVQALFSRVGMRSPFHYHFGDSMVVANFLMDSGLLPQGKVSLGDLCSRFGIVGDWHTALDDTKASAQLYFKLQELAKKGVTQ